MTENNALQGFIELVEKKYDLKVVDSQYVKVDEKYDIYNFMLEVKMSDKMWAKFQEKYAGENSAMHVAWSVYRDKVRFNAEVGNNILLLLDTIKP